MKAQADKHRSLRSFQPGDLVYLKAQPYVQTSLAQISSNKLAFRFFGSFLIIEKIGQSAYRLQLPPYCLIHPVFHVSQLKKAVPSTAVVPQAILDRRLRQQNDTMITQVLDSNSDENSTAYSRRDSNGGVLVISLDRSDTGQRRSILQPAPAPASQDERPHDRLLRRATAKAQQGGAAAAAPAGGSDDPELGAFLVKADAAKTEMAALRDELSHLRSAHEASKNAVVGAGGRSPRTAGAEQEETAKEVAEVERGLVELQQLFLDMAALVEAQGAPLDDIERQVGAAAGDVAAAEAELREARRLQGAARRRRVCLAGGIAALLLVGVAVAVVVALVLARRGGGGGKLVVQLAAALPAR
ncbi:unnamed protein product [Miscanthus lutarioriparius]|uniref:t-SNARE coiled-coil homology domain-containing protein n=1 Tax=Miscanthus lutarioriparius TaxID=422564 RepID=A0A811RIT2_9POAL|nr:unnamed protein product [Miscanthus lutarioriparius]